MFITMLRVILMYLCIPHMGYLAWREYTSQRISIYYKEKVPGDSEYLTFFYLPQAIFGVSVFGSHILSTSAAFACARARHPDGTGDSILTLKKIRAVATVQLAISSRGQMSTRASYGSPALANRGAKSNAPTVRSTATISVQSLHVALPSGDFCILHLLPFGSTCFTAELLA